jgi:Domain of unknown function (DUF1929)
VMADGQVVVSGGSSVDNQLVDVAYHLEIWNPATGTWTRGPSAQKPRLYHSISMLMPDGTVLTGGGGAPGPVANLNAEIYYPSYLYRKDGSGLPAVRPQIIAAPTAATWNTRIGTRVDAATTVSRVTLVRFGSVTHAFNNDQRFMPLAFEQTGQEVQITMPADRNVMIPGNYMLFVFNADGTPSVARTLKIGD